MGQRAKTERNTALIALYLTGLSLKAVGRRFEISEARVRQILRGAGVKTRKYSGAYVSNLPEVKAYHERMGRAA